MNYLKNTHTTNRIRVFAAATMVALLPGCAGPQLPVESASSPASTAAPESPPHIATISLDDGITGSIAARLKETSSSQSKTHQHHADSPDPRPAAQGESQNAMYTCPMHPEIKQPEPGDCSICGMDLVPI